MKTYKIGDKAWYAQRKSFQNAVECPDCFGQKFLTVIKGNGSRVTIDCAGCQAGYDPPIGYVTYHEHKIDVSEITIQKIEITPEGTRYGFRECYSTDETEIFDTKEGAEKRALELAQKHNREEIDKINRKEKHNRTWSWNAYYHRRQIKNAEKDLVYHTAKLDVAKIKAKETK